MAELLSALFQRPNFVVFVILFLWGIYIMAAHPNYVKKLIGLYIVQTSVIFFLVAFPHVLTVTAIVVQVATLGVSLALVSGIYRKYGSLDEDEVLKRVE
jgi:multicomponent Na+:H+ antiporter subunit C